jgi:integrase/recombinase XerD
MQFPAALDGYWIARRRDLSPNTIADYDLHFRRFSTFIADKPVDNITSQDIHKFLNHVRTTHSLGDKTLANTWMALSSFFTWLEKELNIQHPIRNRVACPKYRLPPIEPYSATEIRAMLESCYYSNAWNTAAGSRTRHKRPTALRDRAILVTLVDTGLRASELCELALRDYDQTHARLTVRHGKGDKIRTVYLGDTAQHAVWRYLTERPNEKLDAPLFTSLRSRPLNRDSLLHLIMRIAQRAGVNNANVHRFRHTFAINFLRNGGNMLELQRLLGHESMQTLQIYVTLAQSDLAAAQRTASPADNWNL